MVFEKYVSTLKDQSKEGGRILRTGDAVLQIAAPMVCAVLFVILGVRVSNSSNLIAVISIITGLMCTVLAALFEIRASVMPAKKHLTYRDDDAIDELFYICSWLVTVGVAAALFLLLPDLDYPFVVPVWLVSAYSLFAIALTLHFVFVLLSFVSRLIRSYVRVAEGRK